MNVLSSCVQRFTKTQQKKNTVCVYILCENPSSCVQRHERPLKTRLQEKRTVSVLEFSPLLCAKSQRTCEAEIPFCSLWGLIYTGSNTRRKKWVLSHLCAWGCITCCLACSVYRTVATTWFALLICFVCCFATSVDEAWRFPSHTFLCDQDSQKIM